MLKGLPPNRRASGIAKTCGFDDAQFFGDVFIGRIQVDSVSMCVYTRARARTKPYTHVIP